MTTITADDIRALARSTDEDPSLAVIDGDVQVVPATQVGGGQVVFRKSDLVAEYGAEVTDIQAEVLAAGLTARLT